MCDDEMMYINSLAANNEEDWTETIQVNQVKFKVKLGTGAQCNVLPKQLLLKTRSDLIESKIKQLVSYTDNKMQVIGQTV